MEKPDVDAIEGLSPAISIEQKSAGHNPRSTVGTVTEVYDYLRLLWARAGTPHCPNDGSPIERQSASQITDTILGWPAGTRIEIAAPLVRGRKGEFRDLLEGVILPWGVPTGYLEAAVLPTLARAFKFDPAAPWGALPAKVRQVLLHGYSERKLVFQYFSGKATGKYESEWEGILKNIERR